MYFLHFTQFLYQGNWTWNLKLHFWCIIRFLLECWGFYMNMKKLNNISSKFKSMAPQLHILVKFLHILYSAFQLHPDVFSTNYRIPHTCPIPLCFVTYLISLPLTSPTCSYYQTHSHCPCLTYLLIISKRNNTVYTTDDTTVMLKYTNWPIKDYSLFGWHRVYWQIGGRKIDSSELHHTTQCFIS